MKFSYRQGVRAHQTVPIQHIESLPRGFVKAFLTVVSRHYHDDWEVLPFLVEENLRDSEPWEPFVRRAGESEYNCLVSTLSSLKWFEQLDFVETVWRDLRDRGLNAYDDIFSSEDERPQNEDRFAAEMNSYFEQHGVGWQLVKGKLEFRGADDYELTMHAAESSLRSAGLTAAQTHILEARMGLSRRPKPDVTGVIYHAVAALESVAKQVSGKPKATLGAIAKDRNVFRPPLDKVVAGMWGFASEAARHGSEDPKKVPNLAEVELIVASSAALISYLLPKYSQKGLE